MERKNGLLSQRMTRREALVSMAAGVVAGALGLSACGKSKQSEQMEDVPQAQGKVTCRRNPKNGDEISCARHVFYKKRLAQQRHEAY